MNIALCSDSFLPIVDGVGRVVHEYANNLSSRGHECYVITPMQPCGYRGTMPFEIVDFISVPVLTAKQYKTGVANLDTHYMERVSTLDIDIVHAHSPAASGLEAIRLANKHKVPLIGTFHSKYYDDLKRYTHSDMMSMVGVRYVVNFFERCDEVWSVSNHAAETLHSYGFRGDIQVVRNGSTPRRLDPLCEQAARQAYSLSDKPVLLYTGQIDRKKNIFLILDAAALLKERGVDFQLVFAGQGLDLDEMKKESKRLGLSDITTFTGHIYDNELLCGLYMAASLFVFPSEYDTAGLVVSEAAMMNTPSVVIKNSAPAEWIENGVSGLVSDNEVETFANSIYSYLVEMDEQQRRQLAQAAHDTIPTPWNDIIENVEQRYQALIG